MPEPMKGIAMKIELGRYPTASEIDAIERAARQARAEAIAGLFTAAVGRLKTLMARCAATLAAGLRSTGSSIRRST